MGSGGEGNKGILVSVGKLNWTRREVETLAREGSYNSPTLTKGINLPLQDGSMNKYRRIGKNAFIFNAEHLIPEPEAPLSGASSLQELGIKWKAAQEENSRLKYKNESLVRSLLVKSDILKATMTAKKLCAAAARSHQQQQEDVEQEVWSKRPILVKWGSGTKESAVDGKNTTLDSASMPALSVDDVPQHPHTSAAETTVTLPEAQEPALHRQISSINRANSGSGIDYSDITSSMIVLRSHQGELKLLLEEANEEGLSKNLLASIQSTVAETSKIYSDLMGQRRKHPAITNVTITTNSSKTTACMSAAERPPSLQSTTKPNHRSIALEILERLSQQNLMSLYGSWQAHSQKLELIQRKQSRLEVMRASLAKTLQNNKDKNVYWKARAGAYLASDYLGKSTREVYWEEWDAIDTFEGTCCDILGPYTTAIMHVKSAPASPNCAAITKEILALAQERGRLCFV